MVAVAELSKLAAFPPVAARLLHLLSEDEVDMQAVVDVIRSDPSFTARILQYANSPLFGFGSRVDSLHRALLLLGWRRVRKLTMTAATNSYVRSAQKFEELRRCWRHTLATALLTEELAWTCLEQEDRAYTAGLLHDIGRLALLVAHPQEYAALLREAGDEAIDVLDREREMFGMDHCEAGRQLAELWGLPPEFHVIAGRHHDTPESGEVDLLYLAHLGCRFADTLGYSVVRSPRPWTVEQIRAALPVAAQSRFHVDIEQMKASLAAEVDTYDKPGSSSQPEVDESPMRDHITAVPTAPLEAAPARSAPYGWILIGIVAALCAAFLVYSAFSR